MKRSAPRGRSAFTLIELLIVVAILAVLAAIAVPNFLEAQTRSKVSRVQADLRSLATATEAFRVDNTRYPHADLFLQLSLRMKPLTTPVAYIASQPLDPFFEWNPSSLGGAEANYVYCSGNIYHGITTVYDTAEFTGSIFSISSRGPDMLIGQGGYCVAHPASIASLAYLRGAYDPTNGTISEGDIFRMGGSTLGAAP